MTLVWTVYALFLIVNSAIVTVLLAWDKRQARRDRWRIPEARLHLIEALGGWPGSWVARRQLRHKTRKRRYRWKYALIVVFHGILIGTMTFLSIKNSGAFDGAP